MTPNEMTRASLDNDLCPAAYGKGKRLMSKFFNYSRLWISLAHTSVALSALVLACLLVAPIASAEETGTQQVFSSADAAASALVAAGTADEMKPLSSILGPDSDQILSSGDSVADKNARNDFVRRYHEMHRLAYDDRGRVILYIGAENWPVPLPLVKKNGGWIFDTAVGKEERLFRRIGRNEGVTNDVLGERAGAQAEYASEARGGGRRRQVA